MSLKSLKRTLKYTELALLLSSQKICPEGLGKSAIKRAWAKKITQLRGVPLKVSQILSMGEEQESETYSEAIEQIEPLPIQAWLEKLKNDVIYEQIEFISEEGISASLGQVHKVKMKDGREMALKLKYPDIEESMNLDQNLLGIVQKSFTAFQKQNFSMPDYENVLKEELEEELNYCHEVNKQLKVWESFKECKNIYIPKVDLLYSCDDWILMEWQESVSYDKFIEESDRSERILAVRHLTEFFFKMVFEFSWIHADPNPGNFGFRKLGKEVELVVYDYGSVAPFPKEKALVLLKMMMIVEKGEGELFPWFGNLGYDLELLLPLRHKLLAFADLIFEPFLSNSRYHLKTWNRKERAKDILGDERWNFMLAAPADLFPFMRSLQTLTFYGKKFNVGIYLRPSVEALWRKYDKELRNLTPKPMPYRNEHESMAKNLYILVTDNGKTKVKMSLPRAGVEGLDDLMDDDLKARLKQDNIKVEEVLRKARNEGYKPMSLFSIDKGSKKVEIYLE